MEIGEFYTSKRSLTGERTEGWFPDIVQIRFFTENEVQFIHIATDYINSCRVSDFKTGYTPTTQDHMNDLVSKIEDISLSISRYLKSITDDISSAKNIYGKLMDVVSDRRLCKDEETLIRSLELITKDERKPPKFTINREVYRSVKNILRLDNNMELSAYYSNNETSSENQERIQDLRGAISSSEPFNFDGIEELRDED